eukprot:403352433
MIVQKLAKHGDLLSYCKETLHWQIPESLAKEWLAQVCLGLNELHSRNIIHRDIKPENILVQDKLHLRLSDFGQSKIVEHDIQKMIASNSLAKGTPQYMSPEMKNLEEYDYSTDIYSLGITFALILTQEYPKIQELATNSWNPDFKSGKGFSQNFVDLIKHMIRFNKDERIKLCEIIQHPSLQDTQTIKGYKEFIKNDQNKIKIKFEECYSIGSNERIYQESKSQNTQSQSKNILNFNEEEKQCNMNTQVLQLSQKESDLKIQADNQDYILDNLGRKLTEIESLIRIICDSIQHDHRIIFDLSNSEVLIRTQDHQNKEKDKFTFYRDLKILVNQQVKTQTVNIYRIDCWLRGGSFKDAYLCTSKSQEKRQRFAMKVWKEIPDDMLQSIFIQRHLKSQYITPIIEIFYDSQDNNKLCIIEDVAQYKDIFQYLKSHSLNENQVLEWMAQILLGISFMHERHIIHRDIVPQNILVYDHLQVKLAGLDFCYFSNSQKNLQINDFGLPLQQEQYSSQSDIYLFGRTFFKIITNNKIRYFEGVPNPSERWTIDKKDMNLDCSTELRYLIDWTLQDDPKARPNLNQMFDYPLIQQTQTMQDFIKNNQIQNVLNN